MAPQSQVHLRGQLKVMGQKVVWTGNEAVDAGAVVWDVDQATRASSGEQAGVWGRLEFLSP